MLSIARVKRTSMVGVKTRPHDVRGGGETDLSFIMHPDHVVGLLNRPTHPLTYVLSAKRTHSSMRTPSSEPNVPTPPCTPTLQRRLAEYSRSGTHSSIRRYT